jgi:hypothetical protein
MELRAAFGLYCWIGTIIACVVSWHHVRWLWRCPNVNRWHLAWSVLVVTQFVWPMFWPWLAYKAWTMEDPA